MAHLPACIRTEQQQLDKARQLFATVHGVWIVANAQLSRIQGGRSVTVELSLSNGTQAIIQFRFESMNIKSFQQAHCLLGEKAPEIRAIEDEELKNAGIDTFYMTKIPGKTLMEFENVWSEEAHVRCARSLGTLLSKCLVACDSLGVETYIIPELEKILAWETRDGHDVSKHFPVVKALMTHAPRLKTLPTIFTHFDLGPMNILADDSGDVSGIVDWELSESLPLGVGCWCIHFLAGQLVGDEFIPRPFYEKMERGFWDDLWEGLPAQVQKTLDMQALQIAVMIGTVLKVLRVYQIDGTDVGAINGFCLQALPRLLKYRIPFLRGDAKPYAEDPWTASLLG